MAKILFVQDIWYEALGILQLSSFVRTGGHRTLLHVHRGGDEALFRSIEEFAPDLIGFSLMSEQASWALPAAARIRRRYPNGRFRTIMGGVHPTFAPEIIEQEGVDIVCRGEGEEALLELMGRIDRGADCSTVRNLWVKTKDGIAKNPLRPKIENLDSLPFIDRELASRYRYFRSSPTRAVMASRGCPFKCSYCFNEEYGRLYGEEAVKVRWRSPENVVEELRLLRERYPATERIYFYDDNFILGNREWLEAFAPLYRSRVGLPFIASIRSGMEDEESVRLLAEAGCEQAIFGLETGSESLRGRLLGKPVTDDQLRATARLLRRHGIVTCTNNMFFLPGSNAADAWRTVTLNQEIGWDWSNNFVYQPYPGGRLNNELRRDPAGERKCRERLERVMRPPLVAKGPDEELNVYYFSYLLMAFPRLTPVARKLARLRPNLVFYLVYKVTEFVNHCRKARFSLSRLLVEAWYHYDTK